MEERATFGIGRRQGAAVGAAAVFLPGGSYEPSAARDASARPTSPGFEALCSEMPAEEAFVPPFGAWERRSPAQVGLDSAALEAAVAREHNDVRVNLLALSLLHVLRDPLQEVLREEVMGPHRGQPHLAVARLLGLPGDRGGPADA